MLEAAMAEFLGGGVSLIVATVTDDGAPHATRGWSLRLTGPSTARVLLPLHDTTALDRLAAGARVAITAADVTTLRSVQLKGRAIGVEPATDDDREHAARHNDAFFAEVSATDGTPRALLDRLVPAGYAACLLEIAEVYDQTPGPGAGARVVQGR